MKEREVQRIMQQLPEEYLEEAAGFRMAHAAAIAPAPARTGLPQWLRIAAPVSAAACVCAVAGVMIAAHRTEEPYNYNSVQNAVTEVQAAATQSGESTETTARLSASETDAEAVTTRSTDAAVTGQAKPAGTDASTAAAQTPAARTTTAKQTPAATDAPAAETTPALPYDPDIVAQYQKGDVDMDGWITVLDAQMLFLEYEDVVRDGKPSRLTPEQLYLADVVDDWHYDGNLSDDMLKGLPEIETDYPVSFADYAYILMYATEIGVGGKAGPWYTLEMYIENKGELPLGCYSRQSSIAAFDANLTAEDFIEVPGYGSYQAKWNGEDKWDLVLAMYEGEESQELPYIVPAFGLTYANSDREELYLPDRSFDISAFMLENGGAEERLALMATADKAYHWEEIGGKSVLVLNPTRSANSSYDKFLKEYYISIEDSTRFYWTTGDWVFSAGFHKEMTWDEKLELLTEMVNIPAPY